MPKLKHYIIWLDSSKGILSKYRGSHENMQSLVNKIVVSRDYVKGSLKVIIGIEELTLSSGEV